MRSNRRVIVAAVVGGLAGAVLATGIIHWTGAGDSAGDPSPDARAHRVHEMGSAVMPFDLERTTHVFEMTERGGIQDVVANEPGDTATIRRIREHLTHEAGLFRRGDFGDPMSLHGADMPGVAALADGADRLEVDYRPIPDGARITFRTDDPALVTAIHRWFGAQLSDHAADATYR